MPKHITINSKNDINDIIGISPNTDLISVEDTGFYDWTLLITNTGSQYLYKLTSIGNNQFFADDTITRLVLGNIVETIGNSAFSTCSSLDGDLVIPDSVTTVGTNAFASAGFNGTLTLSRNPSYTDISEGAYKLNTFSGPLSIPENVDTIYSEAFTGCTGFTSLTIENGVQELQLQSFYGCTGLTTISIPSSCTSIDSNVFSNCSSVQTIYADIPSENWVGTNALSNCGSAGSKLYVPDEKMSGYGSEGSTGFQGFPGTFQQWTSYPNPMP